LPGGASWFSLAILAASSVVVSHVHGAADRTVLQKPLSCGRRGHRGDPMAAPVRPANLRAGSQAIGVIGELVCGLLVVVVAVLQPGGWSERLGALALMVVAMFATSRLIDVSIATGMMGLAFPSMPSRSCARVCRLGRGHPAPRRRSSAHHDGGDHPAGLRRWMLMRTAALRRLRSISLALDEDSRGTAPVPSGGVACCAPTAMAAPESGADWPGFRGRIATALSLACGSRQLVCVATRGAMAPADWTGWSSFAVRGHLIYTQEQRGEDEVVACYDATTGKPVWAHRTRPGFGSPMPAPSACDTDPQQWSRVCIWRDRNPERVDARNGAPVGRPILRRTPTRKSRAGASPVRRWWRRRCHRRRRRTARWLRRGHCVRRWVGPVGGDGYSSPQLFMIDGVAQVVLLSGQGAVSVTPADGTLLWQYPWPSGARIVQPA